MGDESPAKRWKVPSRDVLKSQLKNMASANTLRFFQKFHQEDGNIETNPSTWLEKYNFRPAGAFVERIAVFNDDAVIFPNIYHWFTKKLGQAQKFPYSPNLSVLNSNVESVFTDYL